MSSVVLVPLFQAGQVEKRLQDAKELAQRKHKDVTGDCFDKEGKRLFELALHCWWQLIAKEFIAGRRGGREGNGWMQSREIDIKCVQARPG